MSEGSTCKAQDMYFEKYFFSSTLRLPLSDFATSVGGVGSTSGAGGIGKSECRLRLPGVGGGSVTDMSASRPRFDRWGLASEGAGLGAGNTFGPRSNCTGFFAVLIGRGWSTISSI